MLVCPACGAQDLIEGVDSCDHCHQPLTDLFIRVPKTSVEAGLLRDLVGALPVHPPVVMRLDQTVGEALQTMVDKRIGCVLIVEGDALRGVFSERDALLRLGVEAAAKLDEPLSQHMTPNPTRVSAQDKIAFALHKMDLGGYRHLPVMEGNKPVSLISIRDVLAYITQQNAEAAAS